MRIGAFDREEKSDMSRSKARNYRALAEECRRQAALATEEPLFREMQMRLARSYLALAESEDWLDGRMAAEPNVAARAGETMNAA
jgi:hypothetical protein